VVIDATREKTEKPMGLTILAWPDKKRTSIVRPFPTP